MKDIEFNGTKISNNLEKGTGVTPVDSNQTIASSSRVDRIL